MIDTPSERKGVKVNEDLAPKGCLEKIESFRTRLGVRKGGRESTGGRAEKPTEIREGTSSVTIW